MPGSRERAAGEWVARRHQGRPARGSLRVREKAAGPLPAGPGQERRRWPLGQAGREGEALGLAGTGGPEGSCWARPEGEGRCWAC